MNSLEHRGRTTNSRPTSLEKKSCFYTHRYAAF